ncbi:hypothetical protein LTS10_005954 [Elasticomyces elasticus]|nr:hypothetical protein LTS10_005954 [Elasticomyces elasticus]
MDSKVTAYNVDWIYLKLSNAHIAIDRSWFKTYHPFHSHIDCRVSGGSDEGEVHGFGDVELEVRQTASHGRGHRPSKKLVLRDVLHVPGGICNIVAGERLESIGVDVSPHDELIERKTGITVALLDRVNLPKIWLRGQRKGMTSLNPDRHYQINVHWNDTEIARLEGYKTGRVYGYEAGRASIQSLSQEPMPTMKRRRSSSTDEISHALHLPPSRMFWSLPDSEDQKKPPSTLPLSTALTVAERAWMKENYGGEWKFLRIHGLDINDPEERDEGRSIMKALMSEDRPKQPAAKRTNAEAQNEDKRDDKARNQAKVQQEDTWRNVDASAMYHVADPVFTPAQLAWINVNFSNSGIFLLTHGLRPYDGENREEGCRLVRQLMAEDTGDQDQKDKYAAFRAGVTYSGIRLGDLSSSLDVVRHSWLLNTVHRGLSGSRLILYQRW